jgi:hypothetical protein
MILVEVLIDPRDVKESMEPVIDEFNDGGVEKEIPRDGVRNKEGHVSKDAEIICSEKKTQSRRSIHTPTRSPSPAVRP